MTEAAGRKVLVVEDDRFLRRACEASLRRRGFEVSVAADGEEGLRLARSERPALVLLDMLMPRLSGIEMLRALRGDPETAQLRVLVLSNSSRQADIDEATKLGIYGYLVKANLSLDELCDRVAAIVPEGT